MSALPTCPNTPIEIDVSPRLTLLRDEPPQPFQLKGRRCHFVGIGGCGMSGLARLFCTRKALVGGSDREQSETTDLLASEGIAVGFDQSAGLLPEVCDLVVISAAIRPDHTEVLSAVRRGIPVMLYAEALGKCMEGFSGVSIAGTHGKSTTTAMLGCALTDAGIDPSVIVGATSRQLGRGPLHSTLEDPSIGFRLGAPQIASGRRAGAPGVLVAEACEYNRSFHSHRPTIGSISSVEADHLDCYGSIDEIIESFRHFASLIPASNGKLFIAHDGAHRREVTAGIDCPVETIGFNPEADWVVGYEPGDRTVTVSHRRETVACWRNTVFGAHNASNAATALAIGVELGADPVVLAESLSRFRGVDRRMQWMGDKALGDGRSVRVYDDYGHHPTEIDVTLRALRDAERPQERGGRLICVFQPHQHSRTRHLLEEFAGSFSQADIVIVPDIYFVRDSEAERLKVTAADLVDRLRDKGVQAMHLYPFGAIVEQLNDICRGDDLLLVMGAGPVWQIGRDYLRS